MSQDTGWPADQRPPHPNQPPSSNQPTGPEPDQPYAGAVRWEPGGAAQLSPSAARNWATGAHLSGFAAAYVALGFLGPLTVLLLAGERSPFVRRHAVEALNFNLSWLLYIVVSGILVFVLIGVPMLVALGISYVILTIMAAVEASRGGEYRYPLTLRFIS